MTNQKTPGQGGATEVHAAAPALVALSQWIDAGNAHRDPEAVTWGRVAKITEEAGEVIEAFIGATGQNPRKGVYKSLDDVRAELLDVAVTALGAYEHLDDHRGLAIAALHEKISAVATRAGCVGVSASASAHPADEHHDAEEREAESEDHAETVTGDREKLIAEARELMGRGGSGDSRAWACYCASKKLLAALAAPVEVDEAKLTEAVADELETDGRIAEEWSAGKIAATARRLVENAVKPVLRGQGQ